MIVIQVAGKKYEAVPDDGAPGCDRCAFNTVCERKVDDLLRAETEAGIDCILDSHHYVEKPA